MKSILLAGIACLTLSACATTMTDDRRADAAVDAAQVAERTAPAPTWKSFVDGTIEDWFETDPAFAIYEGHTSTTAACPIGATPGSRPAPLS